ncbi:EAL and HDOD domain-containing protein [Alloalcanivorax gelatiniphagus]|uniref:HDOD domain-containing protein n=1 Tax=Alloalcanivorax gelatiniphagus TaxID=1194167 RepID=A0ABY2XGT4_9GAMM|nr:HDOD domain-containing protein [Alloalcanivorax gelatiniphagus]TMW10468.1 HDOD domain-containing protein [Alloalcanivorax gelatiniphagus]
MSKTRVLLEKEQKLEVLLACRPIYTRGQDVAALQLLVQGENGKEASLADLEHSGPIILGTYTSLFQKGRIKSVPSFLRVTEEMLMSPSLPSLPRRQYILEIPGELVLTSDLVERLRDLARRGYRLALADYDPDDDELDVLLDIIHIVKVNTRALDQAGVERAAERLRRHGVERLADHLDDREVFRRCLDLGFDYYQGDFLSTPEPVKGKKIAASNLLLLQLLSELHNPDASPARLEQIAMKDAQLTWRILKSVNSAAMGLRREVNTLSHAIALLGMDELRRWANLFLVEGAPDKPEALAREMLIRGRMCETLSELCDRPDPVDHFIVGLLSQLDTLLDIGMEELMDQVPLNQSIKLALLTRAGGLGEILTEVEAYQAGRFDELHLLKERAYYEVAYRHSVAWARQVQQVMRLPRR